MENDFVDVVVRDIIDYGYTMVVTKPTNLPKVMNDNSVNFIKPEEPLIIISLWSFIKLLSRVCWDTIKGIR